MNTLTFCRGLLYAVRAGGTESFLASGAKFHDAFAAAVRVAKDLPLDDGKAADIDLNGDLLNGDLAFGTYDGAEALVLEGEEDLILTLMNPPLRRAAFKIDNVDAAAQLKRLGNAAWFARVAEAFRSRLS